MKGYNEKYNIEEADENYETQEQKDEEDRQKIESERGMSPTMSLVIGIIIGSFTAMILIVIIVLKVRTGVDIAEYKQVRAKHYLSPLEHGHKISAKHRVSKKKFNFYIIISIKQKSNFLYLEKNTK